MDASGNLTFSEDGHCITLLGVKDLIVVQSGDATMVCHKDKAQQVKALAQAVGEKSFSHLNIESGRCLIVWELIMVQNESA